MITKFKIFENYKPGNYEIEEIERTIDELNLDYFPIELAAYFNSAISHLFGKSYLSKIQNCDYNEVETRKNVEDKLIEYGRDPKNFDKIKEEIESGIIYSPLVLVVNDVPYLVAGNTRIMVSKILNKPVHIKEIIYKKPSKFTDGRFERGDYVYYTYKNIIWLGDLIKADNNMKYLVLEVRDISLKVMNEKGEYSFINKKYFETDIEHNLKKYNL